MQPMRGPAPGGSSRYIHCRDGSRTVDQPRTGVQSDRRVDRAARLESQGMSPTDDELHRLAAQVGERILARGQMLVTAESCTGGLDRQALHRLAGQLRLVPRRRCRIRRRAQGRAARRSSGDACRARCGQRDDGARDGDRRACMAGRLTERRRDRRSQGRPAAPSEKPVGTVWLAWAAPGPRGDTVRVLRRRYEGDRDAVRRQAVADALGGLLGPDG